MAIPNLWRTKRQRYRLEGSLCLTCNQTIFPPRPLCRQCQQKETGEQQTADTDYHYFLTVKLPNQAELLTAGDD